HHTSDARNLLSQAQKVARRIIIMEDIYSNRFQRFITQHMDSLANLEFYGHPHSNRSDSEWRDLFSELGLQLTHVEYINTLYFFRQVVYVLERG
ncbi:MAG: SAM-dependent methyltransferase, partial [Spirochaetota bacterium]|nr:SAM-dependent methyltransferase [Spirochaetota bacterium]